MQNMPHDSGQIKAKAPGSLNKVWIQRIKTAVYKHQDVEALYLSSADDEFVDYWIIIPGRDPEITRRLIEDQQAIIGQFAQMTGPNIYLDFHIIYRNGRNPDELVPTGARLIPR